MILPEIGLNLLALTVADKTLSTDEHHHIIANGALWNQKPGQRILPQDESACVSTRIFSLASGGPASRADVDCLGDGELPMRKRLAMTLSGL